MNPRFEDIRAAVLREVTPCAEERTRVQGLAEKIIEKVEDLAKDLDFAVSVRLEGSLAKDTWLSGEADVDIFMEFPPSIERRKFEKVALEIARKAMKDYRSIERFAEHPYLEAWMDGTRVNIVPCYKVKQDEWKSATDRTPFHTEFMKKNLDERLKSEVRLLKKFLKGVCVYGAEIKVGGFSGYLCELLVLHYRSFLKVLDAMDSSGEKIILDPANLYYRKGELEKLFNSRFIVVDPVDRHRNVASAVAQEKLNELIVASRLFLETPRIEFFRQRETQPFSSDGVTITIDAKGTDLLFIKISRVEVAPDILWGQLYKSVKSIENFLRQNDFQVLRTAAWSDEKEVSILLLELERNLLPMTKKHFGPPIFKRTESRNFLAKYLGSKELIAGPWIEDGLWIAQIRRRHMDARVLLEKRLKTGGRDFGVASFISEALKRDLEIYVDDEILNFYSSKTDFAAFLTDFLYGRPKWLEPP